MDYFDDKEIREYFNQDESFDPETQDEKAEFTKFLTRVKYGFKKVFGDGWKDELTTQLREWDGLTLWAYLKQNGSVGYNLGGQGCGVSIDIEFGTRIYISQWWPK
jgi:hypothetical protein